MKNFIALMYTKKATINIYEELYSFDVLQSWTKYLEQNGKIQQNWTGKEKFEIYFACFLTTIPKV